MIISWNDNESHLWEVIYKKSSSCDFYYSKYGLQNTASKVCPYKILNIVFKSSESKVSFYSEANYLQLTWYSHKHVHWTHAHV